MSFLSLHTSAFHNYCNIRSKPYLNSYETMEKKERGRQGSRVREKFIIWENMNCQMNPNSNKRFKWEDFI